MPEVITSKQGKDEGEVVDLKKTVTVYTTAKNKHADEGFEMQMHEKQVEAAVAAGLVTKDKPKSK